MVSLKVRRVVPDTLLHHVTERTRTNMEGGNESAITDPQSEEEITMTEFLEEQEKLEKDAHVVLGGSDHTNCTYTEVRQSTESKFRYYRPLEFRFGQSTNRHVCTSNFAFLFLTCDSLSYRKKLCCYSISDTCVLR